MSNPTKKLVQMHARLDAIVEMQEQDAEVRSRDVALLRKVAELLVAFPYERNRVEEIAGQLESGVYNWRTMFSTLVEMPAGFDINNPLESLKS